MKSFNIKCKQDLIENYCSECGKAATKQWLIQSMNTAKATVHICKSCFKTFVLSLVKLL